MATQSQKYNGSNSFNNRAEIDFIHQKVKFDPVKGKSPYIIFFMNLIIKTTMIFYLTIYTISFAYDLNLPDTVYQSLLYVPITISFLFSLIYLNKYWRLNVFPKWNYYQSWSKRKRVVRSEAIIDNKFIIPYFSNIGLRYKVTDDYCKYLKKIKIDNLYKDNDADWFCIFEFIKHPIKGVMELEFA